MQNDAWRNKNKMSRNTYKHEIFFRIMKGMATMDKNYMVIITVHIVVKMVKVKVTR